MKTMKAQCKALILFSIPAAVLLFFLLSIDSYSADSIDIYSADSIDAYSVEISKSRMPMPELEVSSIYGRLDLERPSAVNVVLFNNASDSSGPYVYELDQDPASARGIVAELLSDDERIQVLSGPQMAGSLNPGENSTVEFMALAEGAEVGIYPARLRLSYSRIKEVSASGDKNTPDIIFSYEEMSEELPLAVRVVLGQKIQVKEVKGEAVPGKDAILEVIVENNGDEPAFDLQMEGRSMPPFIMAVNKNEPAGKEASKELNLRAGDSAPLHLALWTEPNATLGYHPVPCNISYLVSMPGENEDERDSIDQATRRSHEICLLVNVKRDPYGTWPLLPAAIFALCLILIAAAVYLWQSRNGSRGRKRRTRRLF